MGAGCRTPLDDQHLAGGILWGSGDLVGLVLFGVLFVQWVRAVDAGGGARGPAARPARGARTRGSRPRAEATGSIAAVSDSTSPTAPLRVLVYSDDVNTRQQVILALGRRPHPDLPELEYVEVATEPVVIQNMDAGGIDLAILDGEAVPAGGMGIAKQLKDEIYQCPPVLVLTGRPQDAWLATWSRAEAAVPHPLDPIQLAETVISLLRVARACRAPDAASTTWPEVLGALVARHRPRRRRRPPGRWARSCPARPRPAQIAGFAVALRAKGETVDEVNGLVEAMYAVGDAARDPGPAARRRRHRRRPLDVGQHLDDGRDRGRRRRRHGGQARQPLGVLEVRLGRRARGSSASGST